MPLKRIFLYSLLRMKRNINAIFIQYPKGNKMRMTTDEKYMRAALKQAEKAYNLGETPIGCVIVHEDT